GAVLVGARTADPEEVLDVGGDLLLALHPEDRDLEVDLLDPGVAQGGVHAPRVALLLHVLEQTAELGRELRLDHHLVAAHVHEVVDVLDVDGALLHAGTTGGATPQGVDVDDRTLAAAVALRVVTVGLPVLVEVALADQRPLYL